MPTIDASLSFRVKGLIAPGSRIDAAVSRLSLTLTAAAPGVAGSFGTKTIGAGDTGASPSFVTKTISASVQSGTVIDVAIAFPQKFLEPVGLGGSVDANVNLSQKSTSVSIFSGCAIDAAVTMPLKTMEASYNPDAALQFLAKTVAAEVVSGSTASVDVELLSLSLSSSVLAEQLADVSASTRALQASIEVLTGAAGNFDRQLPRKYLVSEVVSGATADANVTLPSITLDARGYTPNFIDAHITFPALIASVDVASVTAAVFRVLVLNARKQALTEYSNFNFNSLTSFGNQTLAASADGLFFLGTEDNDDGTNIDASLTTGASDFGSSFNKRVTRVYAGYKSDGDMEFSTITSQDGLRRYPLERNGITEIQQRRVITGRGPKSRYWQFGANNRDGADFEVESILVHSEKIRKRII